MAFRVPTSDVSVVDLTCELITPTSYNAVCSVMENAANGELKNVLGYTTDKVVSTDFKGEICTSVFDADASFMLNPTFLKVIAWYDNEWGYSCKLLEMIKIIMK
jgi:glyceraldehyde 3-phosphate dehydrogenase